MESKSFNDIANTARVLAKAAPEAAARLIKAKEELALYWQHKELRHLLSDHQREAELFASSAQQFDVMFHELAILCRKELPELRLKWVRIGPAWRMDDKSTDWGPIIDELRFIEDEALTRHFAAVGNSKLLSSNPVPEWLGDGKIRIAGEVHFLTGENDQLFIETLLNNGGAALTPDLIDAEVTNPSTTAKRLREWNDGILAAYIETPEGKRGAGYRTTILDARNLAKNS